VHLRHRYAALAAFATIAVLAAGCTSDDDGASPTTTTEAPAPEIADPGPAELEAGAGTGQVWVRTDPNTDLVLYGADGEPVPVQRVGDDGDVVFEDTRTTDDAGATVMRFVEPGQYVVKAADDDEVNTEVLTVTGLDEHPDADFYESQEIEPGYGYLTARDGTQLAINVTLPGPVEEGPYPTVIEYSGYDPASPTASTVTISKLLASQLGFATVGVNIRGSGCSGGSFFLWEDAQATDGYDVVETIAAQDWVKGDVGMVGISYPASAMLYTAATQPPSLAAIAPMAAYDDGFRALLWPGGIQNKGFARNWIQERYEEAKDPNPSEWVKTRIAEGDETCADNMALRGQNVDLASLIDVLPFYPEINGLGDAFAPQTFVDQIEVPTYLVAAWQDEQVGGHAATMIPQWDDVEDAWFTLTNGYHAEGLAQASTLQGWLEFLQLFVAEQVPDTTSLTGLYPTVTGAVIGDGEAAAEAPVPEENYDPDMTYDEALAQFRERPRVRVIVDSGGAADLPPGVPSVQLEYETDTFPPSNVEPTTWYLGADGTLTTEAPTEADDEPGTIDAYTSDPSLRPEDNLPDGQDSWARLPKYDWVSPSQGSALSYLTPTFDEDTVMVGSASADLWVRSSEADTDLQVTLTEVRPDGEETYIQSGWLRASKRALDEDQTTELQPIISQLEGDAEPMPEGEFEPMRVEVYPFAHALRAGSKLRLIISAPGADRPVWSFVTLEGTQENEVARSEDRPSALVLPVVPGLQVETDLPVCPSLRGQPCRTYEPITNDQPEA
jgi:predicted acyl esterase